MKDSITPNDDGLPKERNLKNSFLAPALPVMIVYWLKLAFSRYFGKQMLCAVIYWAVYDVPLSRNMLPEVVSNFVLT